MGIINKILLLIIVGQLTFIGFHAYYTIRKRTPVTIVKATTDSRGLISVVYVQDSDTLALDYLTVKELDSLISVGR